VRRADDLARFTYRRNGPVIDGLTLTVDTRQRTATTELGGDYWPMFSDADSEQPSLDWGIPPGGAQLQFAATSGTPTVTVRSRSAWIS